MNLAITKSPVTRPFSPSPPHWNKYITVLDKVENNLAKFLQINQRLLLSSLIYTPINGFILNIYKGNQGKSTKISPKGLLSTLTPRYISP